MAVSINLISIVKIKRNNIIVTYFGTIANLLTLIFSVLELISCSIFSSSSGVKWTFRGFTISNKKGRPIPNVRTSTSSRPDELNRAPDQQNKKTWTSIMILDSKNFVFHLCYFNHHIILCLHELILLILYRWTTLYAKDRDQKIRLAYIDFAYKKTKDTYKLADMFFKNSQFSIAYNEVCLHRLS